MTTKEIKEKLINDVKWEIIYPQTGGQQCGMPKPKVCLISEETGIKIAIDYYRSQAQNREFCMTLFELALEEIVK